MGVFPFRNLRGVRQEDFLLLKGGELSYGQMRYLHHCTEQVMIVFILVLVNDFWIKIKCYYYYYPVYSFPVYLTLGHLPDTQGCLGAGKISKKSDEFQTGP